jgi:hypothetical protein
VNAADATTPALPVTLQVEFAPTVEEYIQVHMIPVRAKQLRSMLLSLVVAGLIAASTLAQRRASPLIWIVAGTIMVSALFVPYFSRRAVRDYLQKIPGIGARCTISLSPEGIFTDSARGYSLVRWHAFTHFTETSRFFLMYSGASPTFVPKRAFETDAARDAWREMLRAYVGNTTLDERRGFAVQPVDAAGGDPA